MDNLIGKKLPVYAIVPNNEAGALNCFTKYPEYNGKDVAIAIFDSGVDARFSGLRNIPGGDLKVIERFDGIDVHISKNLHINVDGTIQGLFGRTLKVSNYMKEKTHPENIVQD